MCYCHIQLHSIGFLENQEVQAAQAVMLIRTCEAGTRKAIEGAVEGAGSLK